MPVISCRGWAVAALVVAIAGCGGGRGGPDAGPGEDASGLDARDMDGGGGSDDGGTDAGATDSGGSCAIDHGGCDPLVTCTDGASGPVCGSCPPGYRGEGATGCTDIDECTEDTDGCDGLVTCTNTTGGFVCGTCPLGYRGEGATGCTDIDECAEDTDGCDPAVACTNTPGGFTCGDCPVGYTGGGAGGCVDIDECATGSGGCDPLTTCTNTPGSRTCSACPSGYTGTGETGCVDVDECAAGTDDCDAAPAATCGNTPGSFTCTCPSGYAGTGHGAGGCLWDDPSLVSLVPSIGTLGPAFAGATTTYTLSVPAGTTAVSFTPAVAVPARATIRVNGMVVTSGTASAAIVLSGVATTVTITVTTESGATRTYTVVVVRPDGGSTYVKASNTGAADWFGVAVALSADGSTLAVGASGEDSSATGIGGGEADNGASAAGVVYVFTRAGAVWSQQAYVKASNTGAGDVFGSAVALSADGSTLAVGAPDEDSRATGIGGIETSNAATDSGAAYVFTRVGAVWSQQAYVKASNTGAWDEFGSSVALSADGSTLAVGATLEDSNAVGIDGDQTDDSANFAGAVYLFTRAGAVWSQQAYVKASNTNGDDFFGWDVALSADGSTLAVGAYGEDSNATGIGGDQASNAASGSGAVYVFARAGPAWTQQAYMKASNTGGGDGFGWCVALSADGSTLAVGAPNERSSARGVDGDQANNSATDAGAAYVFTRAGGVWSQQAYVKASNTNGLDWFGTAVALSADGSTLAVGAYRESSNATGIGGDQTDNSAPRAGAAYVFTRAGATWSQRTYVKASNTDADDQLGRALALSGDGSTLAVGALFESSNATGIGGDQTNNSAGGSGAVYVY